VLKGLASSARGEDAGVGCLLCNTAIERAPHDPTSRAHVLGYVERIEAAFANALSNAFNGGSLQDRVDLQTEARFFASHLLGQLTLIRANVAPDVVESAAMVALQHLKSLRRAQP
jgi:hypothetical protein